MRLGGTSTEWRLHLGMGTPKIGIGIGLMIICASIEDTGLDIAWHTSSYIRCIAYHRAFEDELNVIVLR